MNDPQVTLDPQTLGPISEKLQGPLEEQLTSALQAATDRVGAHYSGESVDEVAGEILEETKSGLHPDIAAGFQPSATGLRAVAEAVVAEH